MSVTWGIERAGAGDMSEAEWLGQWTTFCRLGGCDDFVVPHDRTLHRIRRAADGVVVETSDGAAVIAAISELSFPGAGYHEVERLFDGFELFVPDHGRFRSVVDDSLVWSFRRIVSIDVLTELGDRPGLAGAMCAAGRFAEKHRLLVRVCY